MRVADRIKLEIEARYRDRLGPARLEALKSALAALSPEAGGKNPADGGR